MARCLFLGYVLLLSFLSLVRKRQHLGHKTCVIGGSRLSVGAVSRSPRSHGALPGHLRGRSGALVLWEILELKVVIPVTSLDVTTIAKSPSLIPKSRTPPRANKREIARKMREERRKQGKITSPPISFQSQFVSAP